MGKKRATKTTRVTRAPRLRPDGRRKDPGALLGKSPSDEIVTIPQPLPPFEGVVFSELVTNADGRPKLGRPRKPIDLDMLTRLAETPGITDREMAYVCGVSPDTFSRRMTSDAEFRGAVEQGRTNYKLGLRNVLGGHVRSGNFEAARWLAIQDLDHRRNGHEMVKAPPEVTGKSPLLEALEKLEVNTLQGTVAADKGSSNA